MKRRTFLAGGAAAVAGALGSGCAAARRPDAAIEPGAASPGDEILGQGSFRYRLDSAWGKLDRARYPVNDCHAVTEDREGRLLLLTNDTRNNIIAYDRSGQAVRAWEHRFENAHALRPRDRGGDEQLWLTDYGVQVVVLCAPDGRELRRVGPEAVAAKYPDISKYRPTNVAVMPDGDFFVSDGYGSHFIHHFDPDWRYVSTFGGVGDAPEQLRQPHAVYVDTRGARPSLLVCDRAHAQLKWFSPAGELERVVAVPGSQPSNVAPMADGHLAIASLNGMVLILDARDRVVSAVGGEPPVYANGVLQPLVPYNYVFRHPHDVYVDREGSLYVAQWNSYLTYPRKLERVRA